MTKKLLVGGLIVVLVGGLAVAALDLWRGSASADDGQHRGQSAQEVNRGNNSAQSGESDAGQQGGGGKGQGGQAELDTGRRQQGDTEASEAAGQGNGRGNGQGNGGGNAAEQGNGAAEAQPEPQAPVEDWVTIEGTVTVVDDAGVTLTTGDREEVVIELGPSWFWQDQEVSLEVGDQITVKGFYEDGEFEVGSITRLGDGQTLVLRSEDGRPLWAGSRGRGGNGSR